MSIFESKKIRFTAGKAKKLMPINEQIAATNMPINEQIAATNLLMHYGGES